MYMFLYVSINICIYIYIYMRLCVFSLPPILFFLLTAVLYGISQGTVNIYSSLLSFLDADLMWTIVFFFFFFF